jgi:formyltetrahydrofolate deformylase
VRHSTLAAAILRRVPADSVVAVLLLSCPDQKGLVASVSDFIYRNDGNILDFDHHTDLEESLFLLRATWEVAGFRVPRDEIAVAFRPIADRFGMRFELRFSDHVPRMAVFVSTQNHCLQDLLWRWRAGELKAEVPLIVSNHADLGPLAESFGVPFALYPILPETRTAQDKAIAERLRRESIDLLVLARYMQILGDDVVEEWPNRIINIHHSFLPAFAGARPYHQAFARGVKVIGATAHYVTSDLDEGPIIDQDVARVSHRDSVHDLIRKGRDLERVVLARAVDLHLRHRVLVHGNKTVVFG